LISSLLFGLSATDPATLSLAALLLSPSQLWLATCPHAEQQVLIRSWLCEKSEANV
jgi:hypothetical protein